MELVPDRKGAQHQPQDMRENLQTMEGGRYPLEPKEVWQTSNFRRRRKSPARSLRDVRTRRLSWEAIVLEMGYACSARTVKNTMQKMGYHKRVPRQKFHVSPENNEKRVAWCQARLHWTKEEWKRVIWTDESSFSTAGFGHRPWVIRKVDEEYHPDCIDNNFHSGRKSKMIWGAL
jgi:hypothetical protein